MYAIFLSIHSWIRWVVLICLVISVIKAYLGLRGATAFSSIDNALRHWTATAAHIQLVVGIIIYTQSPLVSFFWKNLDVAVHDSEILFFGLIHIAFMFLSIVLVTIGSALAKRRNTDPEKFKTVFVWFIIALLLILIAIPWPFSPFVDRPYFR